MEVRPSHYPVWAEGPVCVDAWHASGRAPLQRRAGWGHCSSSPNLANPPQLHTHTLSPLSHLEGLSTRRTLVCYDQYHHQTVTLLNPEEELIMVYLAHATDCIVLFIKEANRAETSGTLTADNEARKEGGVGVSPSNTGFQIVIEQSWPGTNVK